MDDTVECDECGHPVEEHSTKSCGALLDVPCDCPDRYTRTDIREARKRNGLTAIRVPGASYYGW